MPLENFARIRCTEPALTAHTTTPATSENWMNSCTDMKNIKNNRNNNNINNMSQWAVCSTPVVWEISSVNGEDKGKTVHQSTKNFEKIKTRTCYRSHKILCCGFWLQWTSMQGFLKMLKIQFSPITTNHCKMIQQCLVTVARHKCIFHTW